MIRFMSICVLMLSPMACDDSDDTRTSDTTGSETEDVGIDATNTGDSDAASENPGERCGYDAPCVPAQFNLHCPLSQSEYQCCLPAEPSPSMACEPAPGGSNEDVKSYCCAN